VLPEDCRLSGERDDQRRRRDAGRDAVDAGEQHRLAADEDPFMPTIGIGISLATAVHGTVAGVGGCAQPAIGDPMMSPTHIAGAPPTSTLNCFGMSCTWPPWAHMMRAAEVRIGAGIDSDRP
jgi:hypothetical protein